MGYSSATVTWEASYEDGTTVKERDGARYAHLDRNGLIEMRIVAPGEILAIMKATHGRSGWNFAYRRRTIMRAGNGKEVWFLLGFMPMGPWISIQPEKALVQQTERLHPGAGPLGMIQRIPGEQWPLAHTTDAKLVRDRIILPGGYSMKGH